MVDWWQISWSLGTAPNHKWSQKWLWAGQIRLWLHNGERSTIAHADMSRMHWPDFIMLGINVWWGRLVYARVRLNRCESANKHDSLLRLHCEDWRNVDMHPICICMYLHRVPMRKVQGPINDAPSCSFHPVLQLEPFEAITYCTDTAASFGHYYWIHVNNAFWTPIIEYLSLTDSSNYYLANNRGMQLQLNKR